MQTRAQGGIDRYREKDIKISRLNKGEGVDTIARPIILGVLNTNTTLEAVRELNPQD